MHEINHIEYFKQLLFKKTAKPWGNCTNDLKFTGKTKQVRICKWLECVHSSALKTSACMARVNRRLYTYFEICTSLCVYNKHWTSGQYAAFKMHSSIQATCGVQTSHRIRMRKARYSFHEITTRIEHNATTVMWV